MDKVKEMVAAGARVSTAIKEALGTSVTSFADRNDLSRTPTSEILNCVRTPDARTCAALAKELGGESYAWALLLWEGARPVESDFAAAAA